jgi:hypothetical protein
MKILTRPNTELTDEHKAELEDAVNEFVTEILLDTPITERLNFREQEADRLQPASLLCDSWCVLTHVHDMADEGEPDYIRIGVVGCDPAKLFESETDFVKFSIRLLGMTERAPEELIGTDIGASGLASLLDLPKGTRLPLHRYSAATLTGSAGLTLRQDFDSDEEFAAAAELCANDKEAAFEHPKMRRFVNLMKVMRHGDTGEIVIALAEYMITRTADGKLSAVDANLREVAIEAAAAWAESQAVPE